MIKGHAIAWQAVKPRSPSYLRSSVYRARWVTTKSAIHQSLHAARYEGERPARGFTRSQDEYRTPPRGNLQSITRSSRAPHDNGRRHDRSNEVHRRADSSLVDSPREIRLDSQAGWNLRGQKREFLRTGDQVAGSQAMPLGATERHRIGRTQTSDRLLQHLRRSNSPPHGRQDLFPDEGAVEALKLPYTTPASEFLYGASVVSSALQTHRRKLYKLYIHHGAAKQDKTADIQIRELALKIGLVVERISGNGVRMMDRMSAGRPHNGYVLEASPLPRLPITGFDRVLRPGRTFNAFVDYQSREEEAINGRDPRITSMTISRYPFVIVLDGILDPGNLGAILRSAFFLGVDAAVISANCTAPLSPVSLKASAGAAEALPIAIIKQTSSFLEICKTNGWQIYAADAADSANIKGKSRRAGIRHCTTSTLRSPTDRGPCILLLGSEEKGLYPDIQRLANNVITIEGQRLGQAGVESLNVSVAAALLFDAFLRKTSSTNVRPRDITEQEDWPVGRPDLADIPLGKEQLGVPQADGPSGVARGSDPAERLF